MSAPASGSGVGRGKLILCGEHAVVYGSPAIAFAVDRGTRVDVASGSVSDGGSPLDPRLARAAGLALGSGPWRVEVSTDLPVGRGMGSSAALAVALVRAAAAARAESRLDADEVYRRAMPIERLFHGNPSGLDVAVSARGGVLRFQRGSPPAIQPLEVGMPWRVVVLDSGAAGDTATMVAAVAARRPAIDPALSRIADLVEQAGRVLDDPRALGEVLTENQRLLTIIGVSDVTLEGLVQLALGAGAYGAKLSGAGGGGVVMALVDDPGPLLAAAAARGVSAFEARRAGEAT